MDYKDLLKNRRSVRSYFNKKVPSEILHEILQETCLAPSSCNRQPWRFIIVQNASLMKRISEESKKNYLLEIQNNPNSFFKQFEDRFKNPNFNVFYNAPALVIICGVKQGYSREDCTLATAYFMFASTERYLGTCWIACGDKILDPELRREIGLTEDLEIIAPLAIGYPTAIPGLLKREKPIILKEIEG